MGDSLAKPVKLQHKTPVFKTITIQYLTFPSNVTGDPVYYFSLYAVGVIPNFDLKTVAK